MGEEREEVDSSYFFCEDIKSPFVIVSQNIRSLNRNLGKFKQYLRRLNNCSIILFQESWKLTGREAIPGFEKIISNTRSARRGGGVSIAVREGIQYKVINSIFIESTFESIAIEFTYKKQKYSLFNVYHPPRQLDNSTLLQYLARLKNSADPKSKILVCGDFNVNIQDSSNSGFVDQLNSWGLPPMFNCATRICQQSATSLDHIFTNESALFGGVIESDVTDHMMVFAAFPGKEPPRKQISAPDHSDQAILNLQKWLQKVDFQPVIADKNISCFDKFEEILHKAREACCPIKRSKVRNRAPHQPWFTLGFHTSSINREKLFRKARSKNTPSSWNRYKLYRNLFFRLCRQAKLKYYSDEFKSNKNNPRAMWKLANSITGRDSNTSGISTFPGCHGDKDIAETFNTHYSSVAPNMARSIPAAKRSHLDYLPTSMKPKSQLSFQPVFPSDVSKIIDQMKSKRSYSHDMLSNKILKVIKEEIKVPLCHLINVSFALNFIPDSWKKAKIVPIHKGGSKNEAVQFRPISLLSTLSKVLESVAAKQINQHLEENNILYDKQFGCRKGYRCESLLMKFQNTVFQAKNSSQHCVSVFIDISKAFDTVKHHILLDKIEFWGLPRQWFESYLSNRTQYVHIGSADSSISDIEYGVPQGSCLGALLFSLYLNCLAQNTSLECLMFVDDCTLMAVGDDIDKLFRTVNQELEVIQDYFLASSLKLHPTKTRFMFFSHKSKCPNLFIGQNSIKRVGGDSDEQKYKLLGVYIDEQLSYNYHIDWVYQKVSASLSLLLRSKRSITFKMKLLIYNALIMSHYNYCSIIWGAPSTNFSKLEVVQRKAIRAVCLSKYNQHSTPLFHQTCSLKLCDQLELNFLKLGNSIYHQSQPKIISDLFSFKSNPRTRSGNHMCMSLPKCKYKKLEKSTDFTLPFTWNNAIKSYKLNLCTKIPALTKNFRNIKLNEYKNYHCINRNCYVCNL